MLLRESPGLTASEYAKGFDWAYSRKLSDNFYERRQQIRRRLTDLKNKGMAFRAPCRDEDDEVRWYVAPNPAQCRAPRSPSDPLTSG